jgi:RNA polymerase sigma-70 factor (ECF subfamily)
MPRKPSIHEQKWLLHARQGDEEAFARLVESYQVPVYNLCHRMLGDPVEAEDAAQEAFLKAYRNLNRFEMEKKFINWILTIASNHCVDRLRRRRINFVSFEELVPSTFLSDKGAAPESTIMEKQEQDALQEMLKELSPMDRATVILKYWYEMSYQEIGEALSLSVSAVKSRLHRARRDLASLWLEHQNELPVMKRRPDEAPII